MKEIIKTIKLLNDSKNNEIEFFKFMIKRLGNDKLKIENEKRITERNIKEIDEVIEKLKIVYKYKKNERN